MLALHLAQAQTFPDKRITLSVSFGPGGHRGMDPKVVAKLHDAFRAAMKDPEFLKRLERHEMMAVYLCGADCLRWARERYAYGKSTVERVGRKQ